MTTVIAVLNQKGGSGKTTIATNLAHALQRDGYKVLVVDIIAARHEVTEGKPKAVFAISRAIKNTKLSTERLEC